MTQPENFTAAQAADPTTPGQVLADIAALRPDLRAAVAGNPSAYPGLIDWLKSLGEPAVDAAIAEREAAAQATQVMPVQPSTAPQGTQTPPAPQWAGQQPAFTGAPPAGMPPGGYPPQGGLQYGTPPAKSSNKALWIILIILGVLVLLGVGTFFVVKALADKAGDEIDDVIDNIGDVTDLDGTNYGDDAELDALWDACEAGDWESCDDLFWDSPSGSEYETFGDTCGNRQEAGTGLDCVSVFGEGVTTTDPSSYGDDAELDALWDACEAENWQACDDLYWASPVGSEYETFGDTCGDRSSGASACVDEFGDGTTADDGTVDGANTYGDDAELDALWDACAGGDGQACDDLYWGSPLGSEYEDFGNTCGGRVPEGTSSCVGQ